MNRIASALLIAVVAVSPVAAASTSVSMPSFWRYAHPEAKALIGVEWQQIVNSPLGQDLQQKITEQTPGEFQGADLLNRVSRVFISSPGNAMVGENEQPPAVIAVQGDFDLEQIRAMAADKTTAITQYGSVEILESDEGGPSPGGMALVSRRLLLIGDLPSVVAAIDHYNAADPSLAADPLFLRASELAAKNDIWIVSYASPADFSKDGFEQAPFLNDVQSIEAGVSMQSGLGIELNLGTASPESATELAAGLQMMLGMMLSAQANEGGPNLADKLQVGTDAGLVRMALHLDENEVEQTFRQVASSMHPAGTEADAAVEGASIDSGWETSPQPMGAAAVRPEPEGRVITIWGLEEGPREIQLGDR